MLKIGHIPDSCANAKGEFTEGAPLENVPATVTKAAWFNAVQRELVALIEKYGGVLDTQCDQQLYDILNKVTPLRTSAIPVARITPGVLCFPEMLSANGCWQITAGGNGTVTIDAGQLFIWRGVWEVSTNGYSVAERTFTTAANKTYHLRWSPTQLFTLNDLADRVYNPNILAEDHINFDSDYDRLLIARIVTNSTNVPTIVPLQNKHQLQYRWEFTLTSLIRYVYDNPFYAVDSVATLPLNWARTPCAHFTGVTGFNVGSQFRAAGSSNDNAFGILTTRYQARFYDAYTTGKVDENSWNFYLSA